MRNRSNRIHQTDDHPPKNGRIITPHCPGQIHQEIIMANRTGYSDGHPVVHIYGTKSIDHQNHNLFFWKFAWPKNSRYIFRATNEDSDKAKIMIWS